MTARYSAFLDAAQGMTVRELASATGLPTSTVGAVYTSARRREDRPLSLAYARRIAAALARPVGDLFSHVGGDPLMSER